MESRILRISDLQPYHLPKKASWANVNRLRFRNERPFPLPELGISLIEVAGNLLVPDGNHRIASLYDRGIQTISVNIQVINNGIDSYLPRLYSVQLFGIYSFDDYLYCCKTGKFDPNFQ